jgi:hypothetical protein
MRSDRGRGAGAAGGTADHPRSAGKEARDALGRDYYACGAMPGTGYRNAYRRGRVDMAERAIEYSGPRLPIGPSHFARPSGKWCAAPKS